MIKKRTVMGIKKMNTSAITIPPFLGIIPQGRSDENKKMPCSNILCAKRDKNKRAAVAALIILGKIIIAREDTGLQESILRRYGELYRGVRRQKQQIQDIIVEKYDFARSLLYAPEITGMPRGDSGVPGDPVYAAVLRMMELFDRRIATAQNVLQGLYDEFDALERRLSEVGLSDVEWRFVRLRYCEGLTYAQIAVRLNYSESRCKKIGASIGRLKSN